VPENEISLCGTASIQQVCLLQTPKAPTSTKRNEAGSTFHDRGPPTANELSPRRVLRARVSI